MSYNIPKEYYFSIVQITRADNVVVGAGIIVNTNTIITCSHVVALSLQLNQNAKKTDLPENARINVSRIYLDGYDSQPKQAKIIEYTNRDIGSGIADIAVLQLDNDFYDIERKNQLIKFTIIEKASDQHLKMIGFPKDGMGTINRYVPADYLLAEVIFNGWFRAVADDSLGQEIRPGFSGSPVLDKSSGLVVGIICEADGLHKETTIIPTAKLNKISEISIDKPQQISVNNLTAITNEPLSKPGFRLLLDITFTRFHNYLTTRLQILNDPKERFLFLEYSNEKKAIWENEIRDKTYLPPPAGDLGNTSLPTRHAKNKLVIPVNQRINELIKMSAGGDSATAQISSISSKTKSVSNLLARLRKSKKPIILLGEPGSGKSLTLKQTAINICKANEKKIFPSICIFIPLGRWKPVQKPQIKDVENLILENTPENIKPYLKSLTDQRRLIIIFDGLDEMSREKYNEHTEALNLYAGKVENQVSTLFSCRIADFSPEFKHHRMVLKPFGKRHIRLYLALQFDNKKVKIENEELSLNQITNRLLSKDLPIHPQNPFSLWLLSLYLREKSEWPGSRVQLLKFFYEFQYKRKAEERNQQGDELPSLEMLFMQWGKLAFEITQQNKGSDIDANLLGALFGNLADDMLKTGNLCSVLQQTVDGNVDYIRFVHHRAQEFFTAYYIVNSKPQIDWKTILDVPRWQETIIVISQMDSGLAPFNELREALDSINEKSFSEVIDKFAHDQWEFLTAERIEFSSRIAAAIPKSENSLHFLASLEKAVNTMAKHGGPNSIVKMLRVAQSLPGIDFSDIVQNALSYEVGWIRENAKLVSASLAGTPTRSKIPEELISSFTDSSILSSLGSRMKLAKQIKSPKTFFITLCVGVLFFLQGLIVSGIFPLATKYITVHFISYVDKEHDDKVNKNKPNVRSIKPAANNSVKIFFLKWNHWIITCLAFLLFLWSLIMYPDKSWWIAMVGSGSGIVLSLCIYTLLIEMSFITLKDIFLYIIPVLLGAYILGLTLYLIIEFSGLIIKFLSAAILGTIITVWTGKNKYFFLCYEKWWDESKANFIIRAIFPIVLLYLLGWLIYEKAIGFQKYYLILCVLVYIVWMIRYLRKTKIRISILIKQCLYFVVGGFLVILLYYLINKIPDLKAGGFVKILVYALFISAIVALFWLLFPAMKKLYRFIKDAMGVPNLTSKDEYLEYIRIANPFKQIQVIEEINHKDLGLSIEEYYKLLLEIEDYIKIDEVQSKYYSKKAEIRELMRQSRLG